MLASVTLYGLIPKTSAKSQPIPKSKISLPDSVPTASLLGILLPEAPAWPSRKCAPKVSAAPWSPQRAPTTVHVCLCYRTSAPHARLADSPHTPSTLAGTNKLPHLATEHAWLECWQFSQEPSRGNHHTEGGNISPHLEMCCECWHLNGASVCVWLGSGASMASFGLNTHDMKPLMPTAQGPPCSPWVCPPFCRGHNRKSTSISQRWALAQKGRNGPTEALNVRMASLCLSLPTWIVGGMGQPSFWRAVL